MILAPSILAADFSRLEEQVRIAEQAGADWFHLDVMDGHFVPNISFGPLIVKTMRKLTDLPLDVHLMIETPDLYIEQFVDAGADHISVHAEAVPHLHRTLSLIRSLGVLPGVALNPATPVAALEEILEDINLVCVMTVNPGFGGQAFIPTSLKKINKVAALLDASANEILLQVDGGIDAGNAAQVVTAGAQVLVAGSAVFGQKDIAAAMKNLKESCG